MLFFTGDWHIRYDFNIKGHPQIVGDIVVSIRQVCRYVEQYRPSAIFLLGDTFDTPYVSSKGLDLFLRFIDVCKSTKTKIYYVLGQHDASDPPLLSSISDYCEHIHDKHVEVEGLDIYGLDFLRSPRDIEENADVLATHQVWNEFIPIAGIMGMHNVPGFPIVISGDFHKPMEIELGDRTLISTGPIYPVRIYETDPKSIVVINGDTVDRLPIVSRPVYIIGINSQDDLKEFIKQFRDGKYTSDLSNYPEELRKPVIILKIQSQIEDMLNVKELISDKCYLEITFGKDTQTGDVAEVEQVELPYTDVKDIIRALSPNQTVASLALAYLESGEEPLKNYFYDGKLP